MCIIFSVLIEVAHGINCFWVLRAVSTQIRASRTAVTRCARSARFYFFGHFGRVFSQILWPNSERTLRTCDIRNGTYWGGVTKVFNDNFLIFLFFLEFPVLELWDTQYIGRKTKNKALNHRFPDNLSLLRSAFKMFAITWTAPLSLINRFFLLFQYYHHHVVRPHPISIVSTVSRVQFRVVLFRSILSHAIKGFGPWKAQFRQNRLVTNLPSLHYERIWTSTISVGYLVNS